MFDEDFWKSKNNSKEIALGWLYNNNIKDDFAKGYTKNLTDYWSIEFYHFFQTQFADENIYDLLKKAYDNGFSSILVFKQGCTLRGPNFLPEFKKFLNKNNNVKFIGHVLDKVEGYYEVHPQTFFIDLNWWAKSGFPEWGERTWDSPLETLEPIRSEENHHDEYTPYWIAPGKNLKTYKGHRGEGWNIVKSLIESGEKILSWPRSIRVSKQYAYAEVENDGPRHRAELLEEISTDELCFIANTETFPNIEYYIKSRQLPEWDNNFHQVVTPAAGISTLVFAFKLGLKKGDNIVIYDISKFAIKYTETLINEWNVNNNSYTEFAEYYMKQNESGGYRGMDKLIYTEELVDKLKEEGFSEWVNNDLKHINIDTIELNLFDQHKHGELLELLDPTLMTYFHFTNVFHYMPSSFYYSLKQKWQLSNDLIFKIKEQYTKNNALIYMVRGTVRPEERYTHTPLFWIDDAYTKDFSEISEESVFRLLKWNK